MEANILNILDVSSIIYNNLNYKDCLSLRSTNKTFQKYFSNIDFNLDLSYVSFEATNIFSDDDLNIKIINNNIIIMMLRDIDYDVERYRL